MSFFYVADHSSSDMSLYNIINIPSTFNILIICGPSVVHCLLPPPPSDSSSPTLQVKKPLSDSIQV